MLLRLEAVSRTFGTRTLFQNADLLVRRGDRIGLVGPNGAGKTTLLGIAGGLEPPDHGRVITPRDVRVGLLKQEIDPTREHSVREEVTSVLAHLNDLEAEMRDLEAQMERLGHAGEEIPGDLAERYDRCSGAFAFGGGFEREARIARTLAGLGFDDRAAERPLRSFSGGWLMRVELAKLLLSAPDVLLLDEPTNHLDLPSIEWFEATLREFRGGVVMISHDRTFLRRHATAVAELELGRFTVYPGNYDGYLQQKIERREQRIAQKRNQDRRIAQAERLIDRFRYKASKARMVQSRIKALDRLERVEIEAENKQAPRLRIPPPARGGEIVLRLEGIHKRYDETRVYEGVDLQVRRGARIALTGPNGAGKSTLLRIAAGVLAFDAGERHLGHNVQVAFYAQHQLEALESGRTVLQELETAAHSEDIPRLRGHLGAFLFSGDDVLKKVSVLSGGEKARLALAKLLLRPANFLVLDEPTNHLDVAACEVLDDALRSYPGTLLFISHDRSFINGLATSTVEVVSGTLTEHPGNYDDYLRRTAAPAAPPTPAPVLPNREAPADPPPQEPTKRERIAQRKQTKDDARRLARTRKRLASVETEIVDLEKQLEALSWRLGDPEVFRDADRARALGAKRSELRQSIDDRYTEWERLSAEVEASEN
jgi:ATP-binding cassette subfamily F protein 3